MDDTYLQSLLKFCLLFGSLCCRILWFLNCVGVCLCVHLSACVCAGQGNRGWKVCQLKPWPSSHQTSIIVMNSLEGLFCFLSTELTYFSSSLRVEGLRVSKSISISSGLLSFSVGSRSWMMCTTRPSFSPGRGRRGEVWSRGMFTVRVG